MRWYAAICVLMVAVVWPVGVAFFSSSSHSDPQAWQRPWSWIVVATAGQLLLSPLAAIIEGCGRIADITRMQALQACLVSMTLWGALVGNAGLAAAPFSATAGLGFAAIYLLVRYHRAFRDLAEYRAATNLSWKAEVWPLQWRIALSWLSGYFIFQLFNPLMFRFAGPEEAGRMGLSLSTTGAISAIALAWISTKYPLFGVLIAKRDFAKLDHLFAESLRIALGVSVLGQAALFGAVWFLCSIHHQLGGRFLSPVQLAMLMVSCIINVAVSGMATYLRAHKQEPYLWLSLAIGLCVAVSSAVFGFWWKATGILAGYLFVNLVIGLGGGIIIFRRKRALWHRGEMSPAQAGMPIEILP
jgi:hypothetical protein